MKSLQKIVVLGFATIVAIARAEFGGHGYLSEGEGHQYLSEGEGYGGGHESLGYEHGYGGYEHGYGGYEKSGGEEYDSHPNYHFKYSVHDPHTEDYKTHHESRDGDSVKGYYSLKEADGSLREVHYTADHKNGFQAVVTQNGKQIHPHIDDHQGSHGIHDVHF